MKKIFIIVSLFFLILIKPIYAINYDIVIKNGDIYDPLSGQLLEKFNLGIIDKNIEIITKNSISGAIEIDASGKLITPGFIDSFQRHFGEPFETARMKDGVTSSVYVSDLPLESFIIKDQNKLSLINRLMIYDISNLNNKASKKDTDDYINKRLSEGYSGLYFRVKDNNLVDLSNIDKHQPLYLDFLGYPQEDIIPWLNEYINDKKIQRQIHIIGANFYPEILDNLIGFSNSYENLTFGGFPFSYVNIKPGQIDDKYFNFLKGHHFVNQKDNSSGIVDDTFRSSDSTISVIGLIEQETIQKMLESNAFTTESFSYYPSSSVTTGDINSFMGRFFLSAKVDLLYKNLYMQSTKIRNIFGDNISPLASKGAIENGYDADLLIIDKEKVSPYSSMTEKIHHSSGVDYIIRDGNIILQNGEKSLSAPKANYLRDNTSSYEINSNYAFKFKSKRQIKINLITYKDKNYLPLKDIFEYLDIKYQENMGNIYVGSIIKFELGSDYYSVGTNKLDLDDGVILINGDYHISLDDFKKSFSDYFSISQKSDGISMKPTGMTKLLDKMDDKQFNLNLNLKTSNIFLSYLISSLLIVMFFVFLNRKKR